MTGNVGKNIKARLAALGKTSKDMAEFTGLSKGYISRICNNDEKMEKVSLGSAIMMADYLGCSVYELISPPAEDVANGSAKYGLY